VLKEKLGKLEEWFIVYTLALMTIIILAQIIMRYIFSNSLSWSEELARYMFLWISWVGASYAVREHAHLRVEILANMCKGKNRVIFEILVYIGWTAFTIFLAYQGCKATGFLVRSDQRSPALNMPMFIPYASVPVGCALMACRLLAELASLFKRLKEPQADEVKR
jgi:TRAP-type C4-dicarboxylate transport system permease small subunit